MLSSVQGLVKSMLPIILLCAFAPNCVSRVADISLSITNDVIQPIDIGDMFNITLTAFNGGPETVTTGVILSLSDNLDISSSDCSGFIVSNIVLWSSGQLTNQGSFACIVHVTVIDYGNISIIGNIDFTMNIDTDPDITNNNAIISIAGAVQIIPILSEKFLVLLVIILLLSGYLTIGNVRNTKAKF